MRHRRILAPLVTLKHYVPRTNTEVASGGLLNFHVVTAVAQTGVVNVQDVVEGSIVKAVYVEMWLQSQAATGANCQFNMLIEKTPAGQTDATAANMLNLMGYPNKKNVLYNTQGVIGDLNTTSIPVIRGWFKIPKGKQRMGLGDSIEIGFTATGAAIAVCGFATYKEWK